jgi:hypothetical protein
VDVQSVRKSQDCYIQITTVGSRQDPNAEYTVAEYTVLNIPFRTHSGTWPPWRARSRIQSTLRVAQGCSGSDQSFGLAQPQLRTAYSSLRLQSRVLRSRSGSGNLER